MKLPVISEIPKFRCGACGKCCSRIRGMVPKEDAGFLREFAFGKLPIIQLVPIERMTFPLFDWEAKRFMEWQHKANVDARISPLRIVYDLKSDTSIVVSYFMDAETDACNFLKEGKCSIYDTKRAYVCRMFPFNRSPLSSGFKEMSEIFGECGAMGKVAAAMPEKKDSITRFLKEAFPDGSFMDAVQNDIIVEWANATIVELIRKNIIKPAVNYPYEFLLKRIANSRKIDFTEFLVECGYKGKEEMESMIQRFDYNADAAQKVREFL